LNVGTMLEQTHYGSMLGDLALGHSSLDLRQAFVACLHRDPGSGSYQLLGAGGLDLQAPDQVGSIEEPGCGSAVRPWKNCRELPLKFTTVSYRSAGVRFSPQDQIERTMIERQVYP
jgi:hypothetical protein